MLNCETGTESGPLDVAKGDSQPAGIFPLVADFYTAARTRPDRSVLCDMLSQIVGGLRDRFEAERCIRRRTRHSAREAQEDISAHVLAELQGFLDRAEREDEPVSRLAHALDGLVIRQLRGELRLLS